MANPCVTEMLEAYLTANGYGGLYNKDVPCACEIGDLAPCDDIGQECTAGYRAECSAPICRDYVCGGFHITEEKPAPPKAKRKRRKKC